MTLFIREGFVLNSQTEIILLLVVQLCQQTFYTRNFPRSFINKIFIIIG